MIAETVAIRQIEFELEKAERGMAMPYDADHVWQLRISNETSPPQAPLILKIKPRLDRGTVPAALWAFDHGS